jgi:hypothetical protein
MSQLVKTKRQANFKDFKRFGAFKGLVERCTVLSQTHMQTIQEQLCETASEMHFHMHTTIS